MLSFFKKLFRNPDRYNSHPEAFIIACYFNPHNSPYRLKAFNKFYELVKDTNHIILECVIGKSKPQLPENSHINRIDTENLLWHKETLLNKIISDYLPKECKYIFWLDADVILTNKNWIVEGVKELKIHNIIQPFEYGIHLERNESKPSFDVNELKKRVFDENYSNRRLWRSFCANFKTANLSSIQNENYNIHGHVGFAWGAKREILDKQPLYDRALIGGADHIIAHASAGQIPHSCISKSFADNLDEVNTWSKKFYDLVQGKIGFVKGDLYHIWHGDIDRRQYLKRIQQFTEKIKSIKKRDRNGLFITEKGDDEYIKNYFKDREVISEKKSKLTTSSKPILRNEEDSFLNRDYSNKDSYSDSSFFDNKKSEANLDFGEGGNFGGAGASESWGDSNGNDAHQSSNSAISDNFS